MLKRLKGYRADMVSKRDKFDKEAKKLDDSDLNKGPYLTVAMTLTGCINSLDNDFPELKRDMKEKIAKMFEGNPNDVKLESQEIIDVSYKNGQLVTIFLDDNYAQWHGEFVQTAPINPDLKPLVDYLNGLGYKQNLD